MTWSTDTTRASIGVKDGGGGEPYSSGFLWFQNVDTAKWPQLRCELSLCSNHHKIMLNQQLILLVSHVVIYSRLVVYQVPPKLFKDHPSTHGCQRSFKKRPKYKQPVAVLCTSLLACWCTYIAIKWCWKVCLETVRI